VRIDHVTISGSDLDRLQDRFAGVGLFTDYGGPHSNGITHMALLGFDDGSYIELISTIDPEERSPIWDAAIRGDSGPCGWAIRTDDVADEARRLRGLGVDVEGPLVLGRDTPDGERAEWEMAITGGATPGATLPFVLRDITSRQVRVRPSAWAVGSELLGIDTVVLGVRDLERQAARFRMLYDLTEPTAGDAEMQRARLLGFPDAPVALASPSGPGGWLAARLEWFGELPCAYLIASADMAASAKRFAASVARLGTWFGRRVLWLEPDRLGGSRIGIVERRQS